MVFSSIPFLFIFLPAVLILYHVLPQKARNLFLLAVNLVFYAYGEPVYVLLMIASIVLNYVGSLVIEKSKDSRQRKLLLAVFVVLNLAALGYFKYTAMVLDLLRKLPYLHQIPVYEVVLPIGISFYTFQAMSYVVDVYRKTCKPERNIIDFAAYISLFPQLIAGPIVRYSDVSDQLGGRKESLKSFESGIYLFLIGLSKKVLLANRFGALWMSVSASPNEFGVLGAWLGALAYTFQIYFDFAGYSDMARGLGRMMGFEFCINFNYPYIAETVTDFWRRWHISLSTWFRDYVYIPLGGNRVKKLRFVLNIMIVWSLTGLWHGAGLNFICWGIYYGVILLAEKLVLGKIFEKLPKFISRIYTILVVIIGWIFFASESFTSAWEYICAMLGKANGLLGVHPQNIAWLPLLVIGAVASTPLFSKLYEKLKGKGAEFPIKLCLVILALVLCTASLVSESYNPFLYFRF